MAKTSRRRDRSSGGGQGKDRRPFATGGTRLQLVVAAFVLAALAGAAAARALPARPNAGSADVDVSAKLLPDNPAPVAGVPFGVDIGIGNSGPDSTSARLLVDLPSGLTETVANRLGCPTGTGTLDCGLQDLAAGDSSDGVSRLLAAQPGSYTITVRTSDLTATDPNPANNRSSLAVTVGAATPKPVIRNFSIAPRKPKAGFALRVSFAVADAVTGKDFAPSAVRCAAVAGGVKVPARGSVAAGRATCTFKPPKSAKGQTLRGRISATAEGKLLKRSFAVRLR
jgi:Domain of unknown function DUF11